MRIGIFARTFRRSTVPDFLDAIAAHGIESVQLNFSCAGLPTLPERIEPSLADGMREAFAARGLELAAVSGTFNMIHPDQEVRRDGLRRLPVLAAACARMKAPLLTLCTGTRDPDNMWRPHPSNNSPEAWSDLLASLTEALLSTESSGVAFGIEPEHANVIDSARQCRRLLDELKSPRLKVVMDGANLFHLADLPRMRETLDEAFDLLGGDIAIAHAKDVRNDNGLRYLAAGKGVLDYDYYIARLKSAGFAGPLILHELAETEIGACVAFLRRKLASAAPGETQMFS
jgi:sugar phosphate isomerase/epimerase